MGEHCVVNFESMCCWRLTQVNAVGDSKKKYSCLFLAQPTANFRLIKIELSVSRNITLHSRRAEIVMAPPTDTHVALSVCYFQK